MPIDYILMFIIALRFIPTLQIEGNVFTKPSLHGDITRNRLYREDPERRPYRNSLVSNALLCSTVLGLTIDMRGYRTGKRTHVRESTLQPRDYGVLVAMVLASARLYCPVHEPDYLNCRPGQKRISSSF